MAEIIIYVREVDVAAYHAQGWICWRMQGNHGARRGAMMRTFMALLVMP